MNTTTHLLAGAVLLALAHAAPIRAQTAAPACTPQHAAMGHCTLPPPPALANDPDCPPAHAAMGHCTPKPVAPPSAPVDPTCPPAHAAMGHCTPKSDATAPSAMPRTPIPPPTDADRAAAFPRLQSMHMSHGGGLNSLVLFNRLETWDADRGNGQAWEGRAWIGGDLDRLWLRSEGERIGGGTESAYLEALYGHSVTAWWDVVAGIRHDFSPGDAQDWAAFGVQGMAPYKFEVSATAYVGSAGRTAATLEAEYDVLLSNRLILQPLVEATVYGEDDPQRHVGSGLGKAEFGLRLRYEFTRRFAPYVGIVHERKFGGTADYARADGESPRDTRFVAGVRFWF